MNELASDVITIALQALMLGAIVLIIVLCVHAHRTEKEKGGGFWS